jgi:hypothetical protein
MPISDGDILFTLSGGSTNTNPALSLGGDPSSQIILSNNLFNDVSAAAAIAGEVVYRCIYANNESTTDTLFNSKVAFDAETTGGSIVELGFDFRNERQTVSFTNYSFLTGGSISFTYTDVSSSTNFTVNFSSTPGTFANNFQTAIRAVPFLDDVTVTATQVSNVVTLAVNFGPGNSASRYHDILQVLTDNLLPTNTSVVNIAKEVNGGPINQVAVEIDLETTQPTGVLFSIPVSQFQEVGDLRPLDFLPIWFQRTTVPGTTPLENDSITISVDGDSFA